MTIRLISFGFKNGAPRGVTHIVDCRPLVNPHYSAELKPLTGLDEKVQTFVKCDRLFRELLEATIARIEDGDRIAFGCFGGRHRSVAMVEIVNLELRKIGFTTEIQHRELKLRMPA
jgi:RNase adapter protein RapZ